MAWQNTSRGSTIGATGHRVNRANGARRPCSDGVATASSSWRGGCGGAFTIVVLRPAESAEPRREPTGAPFRGGESPLPSAAMSDGLTELLERAAEDPDPRALVDAGFRIILGRAADDGA